MTNDSLYAVMMAGGVGSRFWPESRRSNPKQLLTLFSSKQLITETADRLKELIPYARQLVVTNRDQQAGILKAVPGIPAKNVIIEPVGRNTAPCIGLAAIEIDRIDPDATMIVLPADHIIKNDKRFRKLLEVAVQYARKTESLVTLGIKPHYPETGYGYIQSGDLIETIGDVDIYNVKTFAEKPNIETAKRFLKSGEFNWNSGMFIWKVSTILQEIEEYMPELYDGLMKIQKVLGTKNEQAILERVYKSLKRRSIDYGIMEHSKRVATLSGDFEWNDVGSWDVIYELNKNKDAEDNAVINAAESLLINSSGNLVSAKNKKLVAMINVDNLIVIDTGDALMICPRDKSQDVKRFVEELEKKRRDEYL